MANPEHLGILKQGVEVWNRWRLKFPTMKPDLRKADLRAIDLQGAYFLGTAFDEARFCSADLSDVDFGYSILFGADFTGANLNRADLSRSISVYANFAKANLSRVNFRGADLYRASLREARTDATIFVNVDLGDISGLESILHRGPSSLGVDTIILSRGRIPEKFLRGVGVPDIFITYAASLTSEAIQYYSCFISYSSQDEAFAQRLHTDLQQKGVRCWFAPENMKIGDKIRPVIDRSIRIHDKLLLILSENSLNSFWVESEVEQAFEEERQRKQTVLFPVRLDEAMVETNHPWAAEIRRTRHIGDFSRWKNHDAYQAAFERLLRDLKAEG